MVTWDFGSSLLHLEEGNRNDLYSWSSLWFLLCFLFLSRNLKTPSRGRLSQFRTSMLRTSQGDLLQAPGHCHQQWCRPHCRLPTFSPTSVMTHLRKPPFLKLMQTHITDTFRATTDKAKTKIIKCKDGCRKPRGRGVWGTFKFWHEYITRSFSVTLPSKPRPT